VIRLSHSKTKNKQTNKKEQNKTKQTNKQKKKPDRLIEGIPAENDFQKYPEGKMLKTVEKLWLNEKIK